MRRSPPSKITVSRPGSRMCRSMVQMAFNSLLSSAPMTLCSLSHLIYREIYTSRTRAPMRAIRDWTPWCTTSMIQFLKPPQITQISTSILMELLTWPRSSKPTPLQPRAITTVYRRAPKIRSQLSTGQTMWRSMRVRRTMTLIWVWRDQQELAWSIWSVSSSTWCSIKMTSSNCSRLRSQKIMATSSR